MALSSFTHQLTVDGVTKSGLFDTFLNVQKRRENIQFKTTSSVNNLNLSYVQSQTLNSDKNLSIRDRSTILPENKASSVSTDQILESVTGFSIETEQFLTTDVFTNPIGNQSELPLFYQHVISRPLSANEVFADIKVLDTNFSQVTLIELKIDTTEGIVYNNLANSFDSTSGLYEIYYVTYLVRNTITGVLTRYTELVSNTPVYRVATFSDLDAYGNFLPGVKAYIIQEDIGSTFSVVLPATADYGVRRLQGQRLQVLPPSSSGTDDPWFVSVQNSNFISSVDVGLGSDSIFKYRVAEFAVQNFLPFFPYKLQTETSTRVNRRIVKTIKDMIIQDPDEGLYVDVFVYNSAGSLKFAISSDPAKLGDATPVPGINYANVLLGDSAVAGTEINDIGNPVAGSSVDGLYGFIVLPAGYEMDSTDTVETSYYYEEDKYEISFINLNPLADTNLIKQRVVIFVRPEPLGSTLTQTLFYLVVNEDGLVIESNYNLDGTEATLYDGLEVQTAIENSQLWYDRDPSTVAWAAVGSVDFVDSYTVQGTPNEQAFLILGEVYVREAVQPNSLVLNDIRVRGGGLPEDQEAALESIQPEATWNWDIGMWDGYPYPGAASIFIDIPTTVFETCSGIFTADTVKGLVRQHMGYGIYPVVHKYNDYEPTITGVDQTSSGVTLGWTRHPEDTIFDVYQAPLLNGPWSLIGSGLRQDMNENLFYTTLPAGVDRYFIVTGRKETTGPVCFSGPVDLEEPGIIAASLDTTISGIG